MNFNFSEWGMKTALRLTIAASDSTVWLRLRTARATRLLPLVLLLLLTLPAAVQAQFGYTTNSGTFTIIGYTGLGGAVTIPDTINGLPVTSIGSCAFQFCTSLTSVTIPNSVTRIGYSPFGDCTNLIAITVE